MRTSAAAPTSRPNRIAKWKPSAASPPASPTKSITSSWQSLDSATCCAEVAEHSSAEAQLAEMRLTAERALLVTRQLLPFDKRQFVKPETLDLNQVVTNMKQLLRVTLPD